MTNRLTTDELEALCARLERELGENDAEWRGGFVDDVPSSSREWRQRQRARIAEVRAEIARRGEPA